ncbi:MAG: hypothetical protein CMJ89_13440 [Planctomycetes bacterium]|jgi:arylsulfatase|nr:hypothetical protein [Planctomycetota bacterium]
MLRLPTTSTHPLLTLPLFALGCGSGVGDPEGAPATAAPQPEQPTSSLPQAGTLPSAPSILLVTVDTLRRDHLSCYGYFRETSPCIDAFAKKGVLFERTLAPMASTYPSHLSILTGLYPHQHGRTANRDGVKNPFKSIEGCASVAVALRDQGYRTGGFISSTVLHARTGVGEGFDHFSCPNPGQKPFKAARISGAFLEWLGEETEEQRPFFAWVHFWDTHEPNSPPPEHRAFFKTTPELKERIAAAGIEPEPLVREFAEDERVIDRFFLGNPVEGGGKNRQRSNRKKPQYKADPASIEDLWNRYDADLHYIDESLGRIFDDFDEKDLWKSTIVIFVADHGQSLGEFNSFGHGLISNINTFVPLIMRFPEGVVSQPARVKSLVSLVDIMPTVLARFGHGRLGILPQFEGEDLFSGSFLRNRVMVQESSRFHLGGEREAAHALLSGDWKFIRRESGSELFNLAAGGETSDVLAEHPGVANRLNSELSALLERTSASGSDAVLSEEEGEALLEGLRELGYGGG